MEKTNTQIDDDFFASSKDILKSLNVTEKDGLSESEAEKRLEECGRNKLIEEKGKSFILLFLSQLNDGLIYVLLGAVVITIIVGEYVDAGIIGLVVILNALIGAFQEKKANNSIEALKNMTTPHAIVKRDGIIKEINADLLVPGDIVILEVGRLIPADLKLIEGVNLQIDESLLTGESISSIKNANENFKNKNIKVGIGDRKDLAFMSTLVTYGRGTGVVIKTGMKTEIGKIAEIISSEKESKTPLEIKMNDLGKWLGILAVGICLLMFIVNIIKGQDIFESLLVAISLAVASIPEGLAAIVAIVLSLGVSKMSKENAIVKKIYSVESLGSVNVICSDKTGTLTMNKMTVKNYFTKCGEGEIKRKAKNTVCKDAELLGIGMSLCNDSTSNKGEISGDPTEVALLYYAEDIGLENKDSLEKKYPRVGEYPFDSDRKLMSTLHKDGDKFVVYTKGAVDNLMNLCTHYFENGKKIKITQKVKDEYLAKVDELSGQALRTLGLAYKESDKKLENEEMENELILVGMVAMIDPPRIEVKDSISEAKKAGIETIMITGDYKNTAFAIGKELGIIQKEDQIVTGQEVDEMTDKELKQKISKLRVFSRVSPENKVRIVKILQSKGFMVAMIGDGVNDAPSLSAANIGVSMGTGTDVAKGAAEIILTDDNFGTIVKAINSGRNIYNNIKKSIVFLLSCNIGEVVSVFVSSVFLGYPAILSASQLLWVNLMTDSLPAIALGVEKGDDDVMLEKPRKVGEGFFNKETKILVFGIGTLIGIATIVAYKIGYNSATNMGKSSEEILEYASTMAFLTLVICQMPYTFALRNDHKTSFKIGFFSNIYLIGAVLLSLIIQIVLLTVEPLRNAFGLQVPICKDIYIVIILGLIPFVLVELKKVIFKGGKIY